ncbi:hypothetical protein NFI96_009670, partial [Prochilodus magdalenae]
MALLHYHQAFHLYCQPPPSYILWIPPPPLTGSIHPTPDTSRCNDGGLPEEGRVSLELDRESCVSQSISPLEEKVDAVEGETSAQTIDPLVGEVQLPEGDDLTLSCNYTSSTNDELQWYHQSLGSSPEFLLYIYPCSESCVSQSISPLEEKVDAVEGQTITLSCRYSGSPYLYWYRQYPGSRPEFLLRINPSTKNVLHATPRFPRLDVKLTGNKLDLEISSTVVSDSVLYYCARGPTVTRSPSTLYKNSQTDKAL